MAAGCRSLALLLPCLLTLAGCTQVDDSVLRFGLAAAPVTLDPRFATDAASTRINRLLYRRLVEFDDSFQPIPSLAVWRRLTPTHYRFRLNEDGRRFHNGARLTAQDVKATYDSVLDAAQASPHRGSLALIHRIDALDPDTVDFFLKHPDPLFPGRLVIGVLPADGIQGGRGFNREPMGSGPFAFEHWRQEGALRLRRLADGLSVEFIRVPDPTVRVLKLIRGEIHIAQGDLPPEMVAWLRARADVTVVKAAGTNFAYLGFNLEDPVVKNLNLRRAIAHAIDRPTIIQRVMGRSARIASAILPPDHWAGHSTLKPLAFDQTKARQLLAAAGYQSGRGPDITYKTSTDPFRVRLATIIQDQLARIGIRVHIRSYDWGTFYGDVKAGRFQVYSLAWVGIKMPDIFRYAFHSGAIPPKGANRGRLRDAKVDQSIDEAERTTSLEKQANLYRRLQVYLLEKLPYVPLWYEDHVGVMRSSVSRYTLSADGNYDGLIQVRFR
ncbi:MAG: ABC transporter substrate-binding protein [Gammaproteobacteria bacterium]|nr:MAG: ABC transporter substrate-binding protein [Gammaproteobacteria bacterium]